MATKPDHFPDDYSDIDLDLIRGGPDDLDPTRSTLEGSNSFIIDTGGDCWGVGLGIVLLVEAGDTWATWLMRSVDGEDWVTDKMLDSFVGMTPLGPIIMLLLGLLGIVAGIIQWVLQFLRIPLLILLAGLWPMAAAATNTEWGKGWFQKMTGWIVAFLAFKPAVGVILALGQRLMFSTNDAGTWRPMMEGLILIVMSCLAPAALIKFIVPAAGAMGSGGGNAAAALASGAAMVATGSVAAASGGAGAAGASGASGTAGASGATESGAAGAASDGGGGGSRGKHSAGGTGSSDTSEPSSTADSGEAYSGSGNEGGSAAPTAGGSAESGSQGASSSAVSASGSAEGLAEGTAGGGTAASGGAATAAGSAAGPVGLVAVKAGQAAAGAVKDTAEESTADGSEE